MSEAGSAKAPEARAGKIGGDFNAAPPPDKPKDWKPIGVLQYKDVGGVLEFRVMSAGALPKELREELHENHGIIAAHWEAR